MRRSYPYPQWAAAYAAADDGGLGETRPTAVALKAHRSSKRDTPYRGGAVGTPQLGEVSAPPGAAIFRARWG